MFSGRRKHLTSVTNCYVKSLLGLVHERESEPEWVGDQLLLGLWPWLAQVSGLGVRQGRTGGLSGLDQQPQHHFAVVGLLMAAGMCCHPFKQKLTLIAIFSLKDAFFFPWRFHSYTWEKGEKKISALPSSLFSLISCLWSFPQASSIPCLFLTPPTVFSPFPSPPQTGFF